MYTYQIEFKLVALGTFVAASRSEPQSVLLMRKLLPVLTLLALLTASAFAQPSGTLISQFDAAMNQPPEYPRASVENGNLVIRTQNCATTVYVGPQTSVAPLDGTVNRYAMRINSPGTQISCTSFSDDAEYVNYRFENEAARSAAVAAGQALIANWNTSGPSQQQTSQETSGEITKRCVSGNCTNGNGTAEYVQNGTVIIRYTGAFQNDVPEGEGRYTDEDGDVFVGTFSGGYEVRGTLTYTDGDVYVGEFENGAFSGQGTYTFGPGDYEGDSLEGTFENDVPVYGTYTWASGQTYTGEWDGWDRSGQGTMIYTSGNRYEGQWANGQRHGRGTYTWAEGGSFTGDWVNDARVRGTERYSNGNVYEGEYADDTRHGRGRMTYADGNSYDGGWLNGEKHGQGRFVWGSGAGEFEGDVYEGQYTNGERTGYGTYTWSDGKAYTGAWVDGSRQGQGTMTWPSGQRYDGEWQNGTRHGEGTQLYSDGRIFVGTWVDDSPVEGTLQQVGGEPRPVRVENGQFVYTD